ncbi:isochorismate synthase [Paracoccus aestuariivivens]|uniref:isochorismate synthase n=1 Tax=Paracoccus aestuariivivens TaxID=1820333 RepID=A0A6L6JC44_9RHOB|nr:isochorismate synthase [Paracoccus aestuariivivens]MTH77581.1 isochorismate synthase [Paracoccus aestuariivivens]
MNIQISDASEVVERPLADTIPFAFHGRDNTAGCGTPLGLPRGTNDTLAQRIAQAFRTGPEGSLIGGALPFDRDDQDCLWQCERTMATAPATASGLPLDNWTLHPEPTADDFAGQVAKALGIMADEAGRPDALEKIVLARSLLIRTRRDIPVAALMQRLEQDPAVTAFRVALPPRDGRSRVLCGATPELLIEKSGAAIASHPLAGSARRCGNPVQDRAAAAGLMRSEKDHREHAIVTEYIMDVLSPLCSTLAAPQGTTLTSTRSMWHLGTRIEGRLRDASTPSALLASLLHPTPAVCGLPMARAGGLIRKLEPHPRDFYAGAVGWCDASGDGAWHVAIRCAEIYGPEARLYAGAGIVPGSDPYAEAAETGAKFGAFLAALGLPVDAGLAGLDH